MIDSFVMCNRHITGLVLVPEIQNYNYIDNLCQILGGNMAKPNTSQQIQELQRIYQENYF